MSFDLMRITGSCVRARTCMLISHSPQLSQSAFKKISYRGSGNCLVRLTCQRYECI